jgi:hypothetical protein
MAKGTSLAAINAERAGHTARDVATLAEFMAEHGTTVAQAAVTLGWPKDRARFCWRRIKKQLGAQAND